MQILHLTFVRCGACISAVDRVEHILKDTLVVSTSALSVRSVDRDTVDEYRFRTGDLRRLLRELADMIPDTDVTMAKPDLYRSLPFEGTLRDVAIQVGKSNRYELLRFVFTYCLATDPVFFGQLVRSMLSNVHQYIDFIDQNALNSWSAASYAHHLGTSLRALNQLYHDNFGVTLKRWLIERRLCHARHLLAATSMKVTDVALESGFGSHAHFTTCFRRRYNDSPRTVRRSMQLQ